MLKQKDFVVTLTVLGRVMHKIIVRAVSEKVAEHVALFIVKDLNQLTKEEFELAKCEITTFTDLDEFEFYVCF